MFMNEAMIFLHYIFQILVLKSSWAQNKLVGVIFLFFPNDLHRIRLTWSMNVW